MTKASLARARSCLTGLSRKKPGPLSQNVEVHAVGDEYPTAEDITTEDAMEMDPPQANFESNNHSPPLTHIWANRSGRREREDEDLVSEPDPPGSSEDEDDLGGDENPEDDESDLTSDDEEPPIHAEIPATEQLTADFQVRATRASKFLPIFYLSHHPNFMSSTGAFGPV